MSETLLTHEEDAVKDSASTPEEYLKISNCLSELDSELARYNLGIDLSNLYTKADTLKEVTKAVNNAIANHNLDKDHLSESDVLELLTDLVKVDGTTPFTKPLGGADPVDSSHLATKRYVDRLNKDCLHTENEKEILNTLKDTLKSYTLAKDVYTKNDVYTKEEINDKDKLYVKLDGTTSFLKPQSGKTPQFSCHLTTKGYVDNLLEAHEIDIDPHGFITKLTNKLKKYALKSSVYDKTQTYTRSEIDSIIERLVGEAAKEAILDHESLEDPHNVLKAIKRLGYVLKDGSTPFSAPLKGVDAITSNDLVTLRLLEQAISKTLAEIENIPEPIWRTSGPVQTTVGFVEDNSPILDTMTFLEIMDAIFYGNGILITVPDNATIGDLIEIILCIHGSTSNISEALLFRDGVLIESFTGDDFKDGCITYIPRDPITKDTEFTFKVIYINGSLHDSSAVVKCALPIYIGLLPKWEFGNILTTERLEELVGDDPINNIKVAKGDDVKLIKHEYNFQDNQLKHPFIVLPYAYSDLTSLKTQSQEFGVKAFDLIKMIPMVINGRNIIYKMYIYKLALSSMHQEVTFNF